MPATPQLHPIDVITGAWEYGMYGHWDRLSAIRAGFASMGGIGDATDTEAELAVKLQAVEEVFVSLSRQSANDFVAYTVTDPATGDPVFQERCHFLMQQALASQDNVSICAFRGSGKTTQVVQKLLHRIGEDSDLLAKLVCDGQPTATERVTDVRNQIDMNPRVHAVFPGLMPQAGMSWSGHTITVARPSHDRNPTLIGRGIDSKGVGGRAGLLIGDDATPPESMFSTADRNKAIRLWENVWGKMLIRGGKIWFPHTPWHEKDLSSKVRSLKDGWRHLWFAVGGPEGCKSCPDNGGKPCNIPFHNPWSPRQWPPDALAHIFKQFGSLSYDLSHKLEPGCLSSSLFPEKLFTGECMRADLIMGEPWRIWQARGVTTVIGMDLALGADAGHDYVVIFVLGFDRYGNKFIVDIIRFRSDDYRIQLQKLVNACAKYRPDLVFIEGIQFQRIMTDIVRYTTGIPVKPFYPLGRGTGRKVEGAEKKDLRFGVPSLRIELENGKWQFPIGDECSLEMTEAFKEELRAFTFADDGTLQGVGAHDDVVMAGWIANCAARALGAGLEEAIDELDDMRRVSEHPIIGAAQLLGPKLEGAEDLVLGPTKGPLSNAKTLGMVLAPGAGTRKQASVPAAIREVQARPPAKVYGHIYGATAGVTEPEKAAFRAMCDALGRPPMVAEALQGGLSPKAAGTLCGLALQYGEDALFFVLADRGKQARHEVELANPAQASDDDEDSAGALLGFGDDDWEEKAGRALAWGWGEED